MVLIKAAKAAAGAGGSSIPCGSLGGGAHSPQAVRGGAVGSQGVVAHGSAPHAAPGGSPQARVVFVVAAHGCVGVG